jgi:hypothetical protein
MYEAVRYEQIFNLKSNRLKQICFEFLSPAELMKGLGAERIKVAGIEMNYFQYDSLGNKTPITKYNIYETYHTTEHKKHNLDEIHAVKCWCSTTENEHWIFIEEQYASEPLAAIASTFRIPTDDISRIKCIKRQGDILIAELKDETDQSQKFKRIKATGESSYKLVDTVEIIKDMNISGFRAIDERTFIIGEEMESSFLDTNNIDNYRNDKEQVRFLDRLFKDSNLDINLDQTLPLTAEEYFSLLEAES